MNKQKCRGEVEEVFTNCYNAEPHAGVKYREDLKDYFCDDCYQKRRPSVRKFFKTRYVLDILAEDKPFEVATVEDLGKELQDMCDFSVDITDTRTEELTARQAARALIKQGSDSEFFGLDEKGNDIR